ncbi:hypothetical protein LCGC14_1886390 [marine sediment metagenome]|uniref:Uncharacterized protein n=1 Tax=marine sediment metagenome TaxID=412755 RepID=A0A0F9G0Y2_9ZZZZ
MTPILIYSPGAYGTSLLAHTFRLCGMDYGKATHGWKDSFYYHLQRSDVEAAMESRNDLYVGAVLDSYNQLACDFSGMKLGHFRRDTWEFLNPLLKQYWPDCKKFMNIRHPWETKMKIILRESKGIKGKTVQIDDLIDSFNFQLELIGEHDFKAIVYPDSWDNTRIMQIVKDIGLAFNHDVYAGDMWEVDSPDENNTKHFIWDKPTRASQEDKDRFEVEEPELHDKYMEILELAM